jgi:hypothetical protein
MFLGPVTSDEMGKGIHCPFSFQENMADEPNHCETGPDSVMPQILRHFHLWDATSFRWSFQVFTAIWNSCLLQNYSQGKHTTTTRSYKLPLDANLSMARVDENNDLLLCSKDPVIYRCLENKNDVAASFQPPSADDESIFIDSSENLSKNISGLPFCTDDNGDFLTVEGTGAPHVKLVCKETGKVQEFRLGEGDLPIQRSCPDNSVVSLCKSVWHNVKGNEGIFYMDRLCATKDFVVLLAKQNRYQPSSSFLLIWDRRMMWGAELPRYRFKIVDSVVDVQLNGDFLYLLVDKGCGTCILDVLNLSKPTNWNGTDGWDVFSQQCVQRHHLQCQNPREEGVRVRAKSFEVDNKHGMLLVCCVDTKPHLRVFNLDDVTKGYKIDLPGDYSHIQPQGETLAVFAEESNKVEFWDFAPTPEQLQSTIASESPLLDAFSRLMQKHLRLTTEQLDQYFGDWPMFFVKKKMKALAEFEVEKILRTSLETVKNHEAPDCTYKEVGGGLRKLAMKRKVSLLIKSESLLKKAKDEQKEWDNRWKQQQLLKSPWVSILEKIEAFRADQALWMSATSYQEMKAIGSFFGFTRTEKEGIEESTTYLRLSEQMESLIAEFNTAAAISAMQTHLC